MFSLTFINIDLAFQKFLGTSFELSLIDYLLVESQAQKPPLVSENELTLARLIQLHLRCFKRKIDPNSI
ncbi:hypothetical protein L1987_32061 [Smallanthus sonchifolius]|uniref:Uncharacterized protein n=1 Tax=Smallanthus sonchifolius TaxID=185202 RepID=A0ACB9I7X4_9ASTR|nr:hypothetical protein L1987_32061 [Smallanthus sonchifolius]